MSSFASYTKNTPAPAVQGPGFFTKNIINPIKNAFNSGVNQISDVVNEPPTLNPIKFGEGSLKMASGLATMVTSPLAPIINPTIGAATNAISNKIAENPQVQSFANSPAGQATSRVAEDVGNFANVAGTVVGGVEGAKAVGNVWERAYNAPSLDAATIARDTAAQTGVENLQTMTEQVGQFKSDLGTNFREGAANIEKTNPTLRLELTSEQIDALNKMKDNKSFSLPDYLKSKIRTKGGETYTPNSLSEIENLYKLTPTQAQDLITQLNRSTFTEKASGLGVDQTKIGLTNEIKDAAKSTFGKEWEKVYGDYAQGVNAIEKLNDIVNLDKNATASDINKNLNTILKLSDSPEGKIILQNALNEFKNTSGIDLTQGTQGIAQILEKQMALDEASKPGFIKQVLDPKYLAKSAVRYGVIYLGLRAIIKAIQGK